MKNLQYLAFFLLFTVQTAIGVSAQTTGSVVWQVTSYDLAVTVQQEQRSISVVSTLNATNVGTGTGRVMTVRLNSKASIKTVSVGGAATTFRGSAEKGEMQKAEVTLPSSVAPAGTITLTINYVMPVEINSGLSAISPLGTAFRSDSSWYPTPNTPFSVRGADTAPYRLSVNLPGVVSGGIDKSSGASSAFDQPLNAQPFFVQGDWDKIEGAGEAKGIIVFAPKGPSAEERKGAEAIIALTSAARSYFVTAFGPAADVPIRIVSVRRGAPFSDGGTTLIDADALRLSKVDAATALAISEAVARVWFGGQTPIRGEGGGVLRDGLVRFLATSFLEKQFGVEAVKSELYRERMAYTAVAQRDGPLARASQADVTYFGSVPNRGAMFWRLVERRLGKEPFIAVLRAQLQAGKTSQDGMTLPAVRAAMVEKGGESVKQLLDQQLDLIIDTDLLVGLPTQRGADWISALRNLGSVDVTVRIVATTDRGEKVTAEATVPARNFGEAVFKTSAKIVRVEVDPEKLYPQINYGNDSVPHGKDLPDAISDAASQLGAQDFVKAEAVAREMLQVAPRLQEAQIFLGRALLGQNKLEDAERIFNACLNEPLPFAATLAWANIGLGEINMKRNQPAEAAKRFNDAVTASRDYPSSLAAHAARLRAEAAANNAPPIDEAAKAFAQQFSQAVISNKRPELEARIVSGELVRFVNSSIGTEIWETRVVRTEQLSGGLLAADVTIRAKKLGKEGTGPAVFILAKTPGGLKLLSIELFEVN